MTLSKERLEEMTSGDSSRLITVSEALAMARELRERRERDKQEPVAMRWRWKDDGLSEVGEWIYHPPKYFEQLNATDTRLCELLYAAPPAPVVPEEATPENIEIIASARRRDCAVFQWDEDQRNAAADSWNACRASALNQTHVKQPASDGQSFGNSEQLNSQDE